VPYQWLPLRSFLSFYAAAAAAGVHVVVGTPGRVFDMLRRRCLRADSIKMFVLDEADEMLSRGFKDQISRHLPAAAPKLQVGQRGGSGGANQLLPVLVNLPCSQPAALAECGSGRHTTSGYEVLCHSRLLYPTSSHSKLRAATLLFL